LNTVTKPPEVRVVDDTRESNIKLDELKYYWYVSFFFIPLFRLYITLEYPVIPISSFFYFFGSECLQ
jgi:hypothetical protein